MNRPEEALQRQLVAFLRGALPAPWMVWHTPNGGGRSKAEGGVLKAMGTLAGIPDLFVLGPSTWSGVPGSDDYYSNRKPKLVAIEIKAPPRRLRSGGLSKAAKKISPAQCDVIAIMGQCGVPTLVITDLAEAVTALQALGVPLRVRVK